MSVIYKLTLSLFIVSLAVFGIYGTYHLRAEARDLQENVEHETHLLAYSLLVSVENALRDQQTEDIQELLQQIERFKPSVDVRIYIQNSDIIHSEAESLVWADEVQTLLSQAAQQNESTEFYFPANNPEFLVLSLPFKQNSTQIKGNVAVLRSLQKMHEELSHTKTYILLSFLSFILFTSLLCFLLGHFYISRPLQKLRSAMRTFRNSTTPPDYLPTQGNDELAVVTQEFNVMTAELFSAHRQLELETQHRRQLQHALQDADKLITLGQLSAGLAHEIGTPLQIVNGRARELCKKNDKPEEVKRIAHILVTQTDRITRIVQRLLEFTPRYSAEFVPCDVIAAIKEVIDMLDFEVRRKAVTMTFNHPNQLPLLSLNKDGIQQIVLNLLTNALAAITDTGIISIDLTESSINYADKTLPALQLCITDTGSGIETEHLPFLFEPYFTTRNKKGGTGLGLAVVKTLVTEMGGTINAQTELGKGSQFIVHLPWNLAE